MSNSLTKKALAVFSMFCIFSFGAMAQKPAASKAPAATSKNQEKVVAQQQPAAVKPAPAAQAKPAVAPGSGTTNANAVKGEYPGNTAGEARVPVRSKEPVNTALKDGDIIAPRPENGNVIMPDLAIQRRACGCQGFATFVNATSDTLDIFIKGMSDAEFPTIDGSAIPPIANGKLLPSAIINPGEELTLDLGCRGGIIYEAMDRHYSKKNYDPYHIKGSLRTECSKFEIELKKPLEE